MRCDGAIAVGKQTITSYRYTLFLDEMICLGIILNRLHWRPVQWGGR